MTETIWPVTWRDEGSFKGDVFSILGCPTCVHSVDGNCVMGQLRAFESNPACDAYTVRDYVLDMERERLKQKNIAFTAELSLFELCFDRNPREPFPPIAGRDSNDRESNLAGQ